MKLVEDLIAELKLLPGNLPVLVSIDEEGNGFQTLTEAAVGYGENVYRNQWETYHPDDITDDPREVERDYKKLRTDLEKVVVLWP